MERDEFLSRGKFWHSVAVGTVGSVLGGLILLVIEYKSGIVHLAGSALAERMSDPANHAPGAKEVPPAIPKEVPPLRLNPEVKVEALKQPEPKKQEAGKAEPPFVNVTFEHFADTYASLGVKDRSTYLQSLAGKKVAWTGYIMQMYLADNYLYLSDKKDGSSAVNVHVRFKDNMRLNVGPVMTKIRVSGPVEIRGQWVTIEASELTVAR
jgi:hypothetical protein